jgi:hypothetical protein
MKVRHLKETFEFEEGIELIRESSVKKTCECICFAKSTEGFVPSTVITLNISFYVWLYSPFIGPWPLFQFLEPIHSR